MSFRSTMAPLLILGLLVSGCDRLRLVNEQAEEIPNLSAAGPEPESPQEGERVIVDTIGTLDRSHKGEAAPTMGFAAPDGRQTRIADFAGKPVLINLWATWCGPCVAEMPTLDAAAQSITVVTISQDLGAEGKAKVAAFFAKGGYARLQPYHDANANLSIAYQASLPTTILYDAAGKEVWRMTGGMDWTSVTAKELLAEAQ